MALLAAMETCWVSAILAFLGALLGLRALSPAAIFAAYWIALATGRILPRLQGNWRRVQFAALVTACVTVFAILRVDLYAGYALLDWTWVRMYALSIVSLTGGVTAGFLATAGILYVFIRGLGLGQRPLSLWFIGLQFRIGIVAFFLLLLAAGMTQRYDATVGIVVYFGLALLAVALARMDEIGSDIPLGPRWVVNLLAAVAFVLLLGLGLLQVLTVQAAGAVLELLRPLGMILSMLVVIIAVPLGLLAGWLVDLLRPLLGKMQNVLVEPSVPAGAERPPTEIAPWGAALASLLGPLVNTLFILAVVAGVGYLLARSLNRRMSRVEDETYVREAIGPGEERTAERERAAKKKARAARDGAAESIRRIYAALVARAGQAGLPRQIAETPFEFQPRLEGVWPAESDSIRTITNAYVSVHYGEHVAAPDEVERVRRAWQEIDQKTKRSV